MSLESYRHLFVPATDSAAPPLLLLHATGGNEHDLVPLARELAPGSALLAPRGDVSEHGALRFFRRFTEGVFDLDDVRRRTLALADFVMAAAAQYGLDRTRLTALGYSNGANIAGTLLLLRAPTLRRAILLRAMVVLDEAAPAGTLEGGRVLLLNGSRDPIVPPDHPPRLAALLRAGGAEVTQELTPAGHGLTRVDLTAAARWLARSDRPAGT